MVSVLLASTVNDVSLWWSAPFVVLLVAIAIMPFIHRHWWEKHYPKVALALAAIPPIYYFAIARDAHPWLESMQEYISFIILLASLFIISGGLLVTINRRATPMQNTVLLVLGAILSNVFGTTGASMLLIRPFIRMNRGHLKPYHIVFFIFIVSNVGGALTPIGDPPLFLGYLSGVPFWWVFNNCAPIWGTAVGALAVIFYIFDRIDHRRAERPVQEDDGGPAVHLVGIHNLLLIALVVWAVFQRGAFEVAHAISERGLRGNTMAILVNRELLMVVAALLSLRLTSRRIYERNEFSWGPIKEVAIIFLGIFSAMAPTMEYLKGHARELGVHTPGQFFFATGALSAVLDNAPTYKAFLDLKLGTIDSAEVDQARAILADMRRERTMRIPDSANGNVRAAVEAVVANHEPAVRAGRVPRQEVEVAFLLRDPRLRLILMAISMGAVLFGACTYIGNGPNFMVKSIANSAGIKTPGFIRYILQYALPILVPVYVAIWLIFFWRW